MINETLMHPEKEKQRRQYTIGYNTMNFYYLFFIS